MIKVVLCFKEEPLDDGGADISIAVDSDDKTGTDLENVFGYLVTRKAAEEATRLEKLFKDGKGKDIFKEAETFYKEDIDKGTNR